MELLVASDATRSVPTQFLERILATGEIREALDEVRPQHVWYQRGRERLREYRAIAAAGGWPTFPTGPC